MKKIILILMIILLTGCADYREINDLAVLTGIAIDYSDNLFDVYSQVIINDKDSEVVLYNTKSTSLDEAIAEISKLSNKDVFIADLKALMITENIITNNINYYDYFLRNNQSKMNFNVYIIDKENITDVLNIYKDKDGSSLYADKMMSFNNKIFSSSTPLDFIDLMKDSINKNITNVYPHITIKENDKDKSLYLDKLIAFDNNYKTIYLTENESIFYNILTNNAINTVLTIDCDDNYFTIDLKQINTSYSYDKSFNIKINSFSKLNSYTCSYNLDKQETIKKLNNYIKKYIEKEINNLLNINKTNNIDILRIKDYVYKHNNKEFNKFDLNKVKINIEINNNLTSIGESK